MRRGFAAATVAFLFLFQLAAAAPVKFLLSGRDGRNVIKFISKAPLETIEGKTGQIDGSVEVDLADAATAAGQFEVDLTSVKTGIEMRDQHMREGYLHTDSFPKAAFKLNKVTKTSARALADGQSVEIEAQGELTIHGVTKPVAVSGTVTYLKESEATQARLPGDLLHIDVGTPILLSDFKVERPQFVLMKVSDKVELRVDVFATTRYPEPKAEQKK
ncbi:MAG: YceI family protein [candidate division Zixibacteria bacterium]|nr:YceI family protein [candidate division Zixibacteria bacterium]MCI0596426.1 YceI family protein [candidate division Zixibacteria bacterium]